VVVGSRTIRPTPPWKDPRGDVAGRPSQPRVDGFALLHIPGDNCLDVARRHDVEAPAGLYAGRSLAALDACAKHGYRPAEDFCRTDRGHELLQFGQHGGRSPEVLARHGDTCNSYDEIRPAHDVEDRSICP
jgi:hypothetical protein